MKPEYLFHGSCKGIEGDLTPRWQRGNLNGDFPDGKKKVVFATDHKDLAALYTLKTKRMLSAGVDNGHNFGVFRDYDGWEKEIGSSECKVYVLPSDSFVNTIGKEDGKPTVEWQSSAAVTPAKAIHYTPDMVMATGTQLFFLDKKITPEMWHYDQKKSADSSFMNRIDAKRKAGILPESFAMLDIAKELIDAGLMQHLNAEKNIQAFPLEKSQYADLIKEDIIWLQEKMKGKPDKIAGYTTQIGATITPNTRNQVWDSVVGNQNSGIARK